MTTRSRHTQLTERSSRVILVERTRRVRPTSAQSGRSRSTASVPGKSDWLTRRRQPKERLAKHLSPELLSRRGTRDRSTRYVHQLTARTPAATAECTRATSIAKWKRRRRARSARRAQTPARDRLTQRHAISNDAWKIVRQSGQSSTAKSARAVSPDRSRPAVGGDTYSWRSARSDVE